MMNARSAAVVEKSDTNMSPTLKGCVTYGCTSSCVLLRSRHKYSELDNGLALLYDVLPYAVRSCAEQR
jgi:hypothetical protein